MDIEKFFSLKDIRKSWNDISIDEDTNIKNDEIFQLVDRLSDIIKEYNSNALDIIFERFSSLLRKRFSDNWNKLAKEEQRDLIESLISMLNNIEDLIDAMELKL